MAPVRLSNPELSALLGTPAWSRCEGVIKSFEEAWRRGQAPTIHSSVGDGPERPALLLELVHVDLEFRMKAGAPVRVEAYLKAHPELAADRRAVSELRKVAEALRERFA